MRWEDERYVRLYTRDTATWKLLPWQGRALLPLLLRKCDRAGIIDVGEDGTDGVAALVDLPTEVVEPGFAALLKRGVIEQTGGSIVFPKFIEAQEVSKSDAARQKESRERRRDLVRAGLAPDQRLPVVYFVQGENGGPVKIGRTDDLAKRLVGLSTGSPEKLVVLAAAPGNEADERAIHAHFAPARQKGEWFISTPGLMEFIADVSAHGHEALARVTQYVPCPVTKRDGSQTVTGHKPGDVTPNHSEPIQTNLPPNPPTDEVVRLGTREEVSALDPAEVLATIRASSKGKVSTASDARTEATLGGLLRDLATRTPLSLDDFRVLGEWADVGNGLGWWKGDGRPGLKYLLSPGALAKHLEESRAWRDAREAARRPVVPARTVATGLAAKIQAGMR